MFSSLVGWSMRRCTIPGFKHANLRLCESIPLRNLMTLNFQNNRRLTLKPVNMQIWRNFHAKSGNDPGAETIKIKFINTRDDTEKIVDAQIGDHLLEVAHKHEIDLEGAWEASLAWSTCHVILEEDIYDSLEDPEEEEDDLLDLAFGLTLTSRLGCQVYVTKEMDGMTVTIPSASRNFYVDGHVPKPH